MTDSTWAVNLAGSDDPITNDDCHTGADFDTEEEARSFLKEVIASPEKAFTHLGPDGTPYVPNWGPASLFVLLEGPNTHEVFQVRTEDPDECARRVQAEERADRQEYAMQQGMAFGCQAYNDAMGY